MSHRPKGMSDGGVANLLAEPHKLQLATHAADGSIHLVTMFYAVVDEQLAFWTYSRSQKAVNLARDPGSHAWSRRAWSTTLCAASRSSAR